MGFYQDQLLLRYEIFTNLSELLSEIGQQIWTPSILLFILKPILCLRFKSVFALYFYPHLNLQNCSYMIRRLNKLLNKSAAQNFRRRLSEGRQKIQTRAKNSRYGRFLLWRYLPIPVLAYAGWKFVQNNYTRKKKCVEKLQSIYDSDKVIINPNLTFIEYFFPEKPLAVVYPVIPEQVEKVIEMCNKYDVEVYTAAWDSLNPPFYLEEHGNYIILNLSRLRSFKISQENNTVKVGSGMTCGELDQLLLQNGYKTLFDEEFKEKHLFDVVNYNLPLGSESLSDRLINIDLINGQSKMVNSGPQIKHIGTTPCFNSLFLGAKGIYGVPLTLMLKIERETPIVEQMDIQFKQNDPNYRVETLRQIVEILDKKCYVQYTVRQNNGKTFMSLKNYGQKGLSSVILSRFLKQGLVSLVPQNENPQPHPEAIFSIQRSNLFKLTLSSLPLAWSYHNGLLKVSGNQSTIMDLNNKITLDNGLLVWMKYQELFEQIKKSNSIIELGQGLILQSLSVRRHMDPNHRFITTKSFNNFVKKPRKWAMKDIFDSLL